MSNGLVKRVLVKNGMCMVGRHIHGNTSKGQARG